MALMEMPALESRDVSCECGRPRVAVPTKLAMGSRVLQELPEVLKGMTPNGTCQVVVLFDPITNELFGERVLRPLQSAGLSVRPLVLGEEGRPFEPDERAIQTVEAAVRAAKETAPAALSRAAEDAAVQAARNAADTPSVTPGAGTAAGPGSGEPVLVGVGSGAINDLGKYISAKEGVKYVCVATAPSMDGFAAPISAIVLNKVKTTVDSRCPDAVVADLDVLCGAPPAMISAGFGDVLGKLTSLADWKLARVLFDEHWCRETSDEVEGIARRVWQSAEAVSARSPEAVRDLMEALFLAGTSVVHVGRSRPTSGGEHLFSHFVEMWHLNRGLRPPAHGHVVGMGTLLMSHIAEALKRFDPATWSEEQALAKREALPEEVLAALQIDSVPDNFGKSKFDKEQAAQRWGGIRARWSEVLSVLEAIPASAQIEAALLKAGCPTRLSQLGLDRATGRLAIAYCRFVRERYTLIDLAADVGVFPAIVDQLVEAYA